MRRRRNHASTASSTHAPAEAPSERPTAASVSGWSDGTTSANVETGRRSNQNISPAPITPEITTRTTATLAGVLVSLRA